MCDAVTAIDLHTACRAAEDLPGLVVQLQGTVAQPAAASLHTAHC